ncbi:MAG TPA: hypothetical protein DIT63_04865 [Gammaproteobacteria bacterium]|nr:hypothetical protein [Gammaproteobacteria bacterium]
MNGRANIDNGALREELLSVLRAAPRPLTLPELAAASELFDGVASIRHVLAAMTADGVIQRGEREGDRRVAYSIPKAAPDGPPCAQGGERAEGREGRKSTHAAAILDALRHRGPLPRPLLAEAAGCTAKRASDVLSRLARDGQVARLIGGHWAIAEPDPGKANECKPGQGQARPPAAPLVALRSDGVMEIRRAIDEGADEIIEIHPEELAELRRFADLVWQERDDR